MKAELKVTTLPTPEQKKWIAAYQRAGIEVYLWTPNDWPAIERILTRP